MGTRSLTHVLDEEGRTLVTIYRQYDGYPSEHGVDLAEFLSGRAIVNGFGSDTPEKASNGMGCLAASLVASLKDGIGGIYLEPPGSEDHWEEYVYTVRAVGGKPTMTVETVSGGYEGRPVTKAVLFSGVAEDFDPERAEAAVPA